MNQKTLLGAIFIIIGILWTLSNFHLFNDQWILPLVGMILLTAYLYRGGTQEKRTIGLLIAGCIVFMVGLFALANDYFYLGAFEGALFFIFLGIAFLAIYFIHTRHISEEDTGHRKWPLYTGLIIMAFGIFVLFTETIHMPAVRRIFSILWPLLLIILGLYIILFKRPRK